MGTESTELTAVERMDRRAARLRMLLGMGGTLENQGTSLHLAGLRMDVRSISDMEETAWGKVKRSLIDLLGASTGTEEGIRSRGELMV